MREERLAPGGMATGAAGEKERGEETGLTTSDPLRVSASRSGKNDAVAPRQFISATRQIDQHNPSTETRLSPTSRDTADGGLIDARPLRQLSLAEALGLQDVDYSGPQIGVMHRCIMQHDAPTHQGANALPENARMHEKTREIIKKQMQESGIVSERQLASDCGMNQSTLHRFMKGTTDSLDFTHLQAIAQYFGLTVSQLIGETPFDEDRKVRVVTMAMQQMPEYKKDMLVAASSALAQPENAKASNGN